MNNIGLDGTDAGNDIIREKLLEIVNEYKLALDTLKKVTGIDADWLSEYLGKKRHLTELSTERYVAFVEIVIILSDGMKLINDDERIKGVIDVLVQMFDIAYETLSLYAGLREQDIHLFMNDPTTLDWEKKYKLATKSLFLHYIFKDKHKETVPASS